MGFLFLFVSEWLERKSREHTYQISVPCQTVRGQNSKWTGQVTEGLERNFLAWQIQHFNNYRCKSMIHTATRFFRMCSSERMLGVTMLCSISCQQCFAVVKNVNLLLRCMRENIYLDVFSCKGGTYHDLPSLLVMLSNSNQSWFMFWSYSRLQFRQK